MVPFCRRRHWPRARERKLPGALSAGERAERAERWGRFHGQPASRWLGPGDPLPEPPTDWDGRARQEALADA